MQQTLACLQNEKNVLIIKNLQKSKFVIQALNNLKAQIGRIKRCFENKNRDLKKLYLKKWR